MRETLTSSFGRTSPGGAPQAVRTARTAATASARSVFRSTIRIGSSGRFGDVVFDRRSIGGVGFQLQIFAPFGHGLARHLAGAVHVTEVAVGLRWIAGNAHGRVIRVDRTLVVTGGAALAEQFAAV